MANPFAHKTLALTSPHAKGDLVKTAQTLLHTNRWGTSFFDDTIDGDLGPLTGSGFHDAKFWLGYPLSQCKPTFGGKLYSYLVPKADPSFKDLPPSYQRLRDVRIKAAEAQPFRVKALALAKTYIGTTENPPDSNDTPFGVWYGVNGQPWCAIFASYCLSHCGHDYKESYVPNIVAFARASQQGMTTTTSPLPGDLVCYDWDNDGTFDHVGFFDHWVDQAAGTFATVEGNTSGDNNGSQSNGGGVFARERGTKAGYRVVFVRLK